MGAARLRAVGKVERDGFGGGILADFVDGFVPLENDQSSATEPRLSREGTSYLHIQTVQHKPPHPLPRNPNPLLRNILKPPLASDQIKKRELATLATSKGFRVDSRFRDLISQVWWQ
jgi:hypothetical protein